MENKAIKSCLPYWLASKHVNGEPRTSTKYPMLLRCWYMSLKFVWMWSPFLRKRRVLKTFRSGMISWFPPVWFSEILSTCHLCILQKAFQKLVSWSLTQLILTEILLHDFSYGYFPAPSMKGQQSLSLLWRQSPLRENGSRLLNCQVCLISECWSI